MPPKRGPKAQKLHEPLPPKTEIKTKLFPPLVITKEIGQGGFGRIYAGKCKDTKEDVAIKVEENAGGGLYVEFQIFRNFLSEKQLNEYKKAKKLSFLGLPHFISWGVFTPKNVQLRYVAMPLYTGSLQEFINKQSGEVLSLEDCKEIIPTVCDAFEYLHSKDIVHADLKAENLMFSKSYGHKLNRLTLIDFGMCGRRTHEIVEQPDKGKAHNGTALYTSTDAHRGCAPSYRADYEILGHNLVAWMAGVENLPWEKFITKLDQVHSAKSKLMGSKSDIEKLVLDKVAASLIYDLYQLTKKTGYKSYVDVAKVKKLAAQAKSTTTSRKPESSRTRKRSAELEEQTATESSPTIIPSSPPTYRPKKSKKAVSEEPTVSTEAKRREQADDRAARARKRNLLPEIIVEKDEGGGGEEGVEEVENSEVASPVAAKLKKHKAVIKTKVRAMSADQTISPASFEKLAKQFPGIRSFGKVTRAMAEKYAK
ncbi:unnamed protein product [Bursaphelenchus okinawaensis]|uniref:non-specific serine/threonine protein kinase n=1 Tax=Bursaphelenchus okinawaensis TaxID=465554 RepID=A0A811K8X7_9BILA|nr:unnamed protein product [Bursaphelenchus okinawaensis]CAG9096804.1 unnamed protein product [Bursaphelenchus okinawaensis]